MNPVDREEPSGSLCQAPRGKDTRVPYRRIDPSMDDVTEGGAQRPR